MEKTKHQFNHRLNTEYKIDGKTVWDSRSAAVVGVVIAHCKQEIYALVEKRSEKVDNPGKWCVPCGYLDWDETGFEALIREICEETSLYLPDYQEQLVFTNNEQPFFVNTHPSENRQNVALSYVIALEFEEELPQDVLSYKNDEVSEIKWINLSEVPDYDFAFKHDERIGMATELLFDVLLQGTETSEKES